MLWATQSRETAAKRPESRQCAAVPNLPIFGRDVGHDVLVEELEDKGDAVGEHQVLGHVLELTDTTGGKGGLEAEGWEVQGIQEVRHSKPGRCG